MKIRKRLTNKKNLKKLIPIVSIVINFTFMITIVVSVKFNVIVNVAEIVGIVLIFSFLTFWSIYLHRKKKRKNKSYLTP